MYLVMGDKGAVAKGAGFTSEFVSVFSKRSLWFQQILVSACTNLVTRKVLYYKKVI